MAVIKRNGKIVKFEWQKIADAIQKAFRACNLQDEKDYCFKIASRITEEIESEKASNNISINEIQKRVEKKLMEYCANEGFPYEVAVNYILYRHNRDKARQDYDSLANTFNSIVNVEDNNTKKSNANIDGNTPAGQMMIFGSESSKDYTCNHILNPKFAKAHKNGYIHIHDLDYYATKAANCNLIDLVELFNKDYIYTNDSVMRKPKRIATYGALAAIALQSEQNEMFGG